MLCGRAHAGSGITGNDETDDGGAGATHSEGLHLPGAVDLHGTGKVDEAKLEVILPQLMNLKPRGIREHLDLNKPIFARTAAYGHFGRKAEGDFFPWEKTDLVDALKAAL